MEEEAKPTSVVFDHCVLVYNEMKEQAREEQMLEPGDGPDAAGSTALIYEGHLTKLFASLGLPTPYYTSVMNHLKSMGCVEQLRRGGGSSPSRWVLHTTPTEDSYNSIESQKRHKRGAMAAVQQQLRDLRQMNTELYGKVVGLTSLVEAYSREVEALKVRTIQLETDLYGGKKHDSVSLTVEAYQGT